MQFLNYFIGVPQAKYAALALLLTVFVVCVAVFANNTDIPFGSRVVAVIIIILIFLIPIALTSFELSCIVTGGKNSSPNICHYYAWIISGIIMIYCFIIIITTVSSVFTYKQAIDKINVKEHFDQMYAGNNLSDANTYAKELFKNTHQNIENYENNDDEKNDDEKNDEQDVGETLTYGNYIDDEVNNGIVDNEYNNLKNKYENSETFQNNEFFVNEVKKDNIIAPSANKEPEKPVVLDMSDDIKNISGISGFEGGDNYASIDEKSNMILADNGFVDTKTNNFTVSNDKPLDVSPLDFSDKYSPTL